VVNLDAVVITHCSSEVYILTDMSVVAPIAAEFDNARQSFELASQK
jgi:hypothetical protein